MDLISMIGPVLAEYDNPIVNEVQENDSQTIVVAEKLKTISLTKAYTS
jgi:hypothetical protein